MEYIKWFLIAFIISLLLEPVIRFIMKYAKLKRKTSSIIVFILAIGVIIGLLVWGITSLISETSNLLTNFNEYADTAYKMVEDFIASIDFSKIQIPENVMNTIQNSAMEFLGTITDWAKNALTGVISFITSIPTIGVYVVVTLLALYFICVDKVYMLDQVEHHLPRTWVKRLMMHLREVVSSLGCYLKAEAILVLISFVI